MASTSISKAAFPVFRPEIRSNATLDSRLSQRYDLWIHALRTCLESNRHVPLCRSLLAEEPVFIAPSLRRRGNRPKVDVNMKSQHRNFLETNAGVNSKRETPEHSMERSRATSLLQITCALLIVNFHMGKLDVPVLSSFARCGFILNTIFVFLSGYLQSKSFSARDGIRFRPFMHRRINRIYPSLHITLLLIAIFYLITGHDFTLRSVMHAATGLGYFTDDGNFGGVHLWFISVILVCYVLFIPTYYVLKRCPTSFFLAIAGAFLFLAFITHGSLSGVYSRVSSEVLFRFLYHYMVFSFAVFRGLRGERPEVFSGKVSVGLISVSFPLYILIHSNASLGVFAIGFAFIVAIGSVSIIVIACPFIEKHFVRLFILSPVTYELYLVHYSIIDAVDGVFHGRLISYPVVFIASVLFAFLVRSLSRQYSRLAKGCVERVLRCAS